MQFQDLHCFPERLWIEHVGFEELVQNPYQEMNRQFFHLLKIFHILNFYKKLRAETACAPFPKSNTTLNFLVLIFCESMWDKIP